MYDPHERSKAQRNMTDPRLSVIIPVWNGASVISGALEALGQQTVDRALFEVIVVNNGSTDNTAKIVAGFPHARLLSEPEPGSYRARNRGIAAARGDFLLFTDADCLPAADWIEKALEYCIRNPDALIGGRVLLYRQERAGRFSTLYDELTGFNQEWNLTQNRMCVTANWLCHRSTLDAVGGFNSELLSGGDAECSRRLADSGAPLIYAPDMVVRHPSRASIGELVKKKRRVIGGRWQKFERPSFAPFARTLVGESRRQIIKIKDSPNSKLDRVGMGAIALTMLAVSELELCRLRAGFKPFRS